jgi:hypothetical protein
MAALWGLVVIALAVLAKFIGITRIFWFQGPIFRDQDPGGFRKAVGAQFVIGLLFIVGWFVDHYWPSVF